MNLRPHQIRALDDLWTALQCETSVLLEAPCAFGKTIVLSKIIQRLLRENPGFRVLVLVDREVLATQTQDKLLAIAPELTLDVGIVCASVAKTKDPHKRVTIASRQSLVGMLNRFEPVHLTVVDECHLMAICKEGQSEPPDQFGKIIQTLREYRPTMRLLGVTATPYRLNDGHIYGDKNAPGCLPYWSQVHHRCTVSELQSEGYLVPLTGKTVTPQQWKDDIQNVGTVAGEYNLGRLSDLMERGIYIQAAVDAWQQHASDRKKTLAFCVTIQHAEKLAAAFNAAGIPSLAIHSELDDLEAYAHMQALKDGTAKVFCSVAKLTTGLDVVDIDCILMARATKSTALYKQKLGRGQRTAPGKTDCLVIDLVGNNHEHGTDLDRLKVRWNRGGGKAGEASSKECPDCAADLHLAIRVCPECGYEYPRNEKEAEAPEMIDAEYGIQPPEEMQVLEMFMTKHMSKQTGKNLLKIRLEMKNQFGSMVTGYLWLCFPEDGYSGYAVEKGKKLWYVLSGSDRYPASVAEALSDDWRSEIVTPSTAIVDVSGKWPEVKSIEVNVPF